MTPDAPDVRGTAQNPDVYFQGREAVQPVLQRRPRDRPGDHGRPGRRTGRSYSLVEYNGAPDAERVIVMMGSGVRRGARSGRQARPGGRAGRAWSTVRLYRPFPAGSWSPPCRRRVRSIAVLDRTKEPGAVGEPLYLDVRAALDEAMDGPEPASAGPACHRRALRAVLQGVHPGHGQGRVRRARPPNGPSATSPSASSTT